MGTPPDMPSARFERLHERLPARRQNVAPLRRAAAGFAARSGMSTRRCDDVALAVSEVVSAIVAAHEDEDDPGQAVVDASASGGVLQVVVCDEGPDGDVRELPGAIRLGIGLAVIERVTDALAIDAPGTGVHVRMTFAKN